MRLKNASKKSQGVSGVQYLPGQEFEADLNDAISGLIREGFFVPCEQQSHADPLEPAEKKKGKK